MKKVLIVTYHWPPSGGITVLRCLKFAKYLRDFGWEPIIFTADNASYQYIDHSNEKDIPAGIEVHKVPLFDPTDLFKKLSGRKKNQPMQAINSNSAKKSSFIDKFGMWVRGNFFIPDARYRWIKPSVSYLEKYLREHPVDAIFSDGPPHTNTVIAMRVAQQFGIPWLADFQDPWTQVDYYSQLYIGKRADRKHRALEQEVFRTANKITIASPSWKADLESIGARDVGVLFYGYDEPDFEGFTPRTDGYFTFFHGGLLGEDRNPVAFFEALAALLAEHPKLAEKVRIKLAGEVDFSVRETIRTNGLEALTEYMGMIPRSRVIAAYETASMLLLPINKAANAKGRVPGKLFEMLRSNKPLLVFGPENGDVKHIVESKQKGRSFAYENRAGIAAFLRRAILEGTVEQFDATTAVSEFSNQQLTRQLASYLDEFTR